MLRRPGAEHRHRQEPQESRANRQRQSYESVLTGGAGEEREQAAQGGHDQETAAVQGVAEDHRQRQGVRGAQGVCRCAENRCLLRPFLPFVGTWRQ